MFSGHNSQKINKSAFHILEGNNKPVLTRIMAPPGGQTSINLYGGGQPAAPQPTTAATKPTATAPPPAKAAPEPAATPFYR